MDLIPKPDQVVSAAGNVAHRVVYGGLADLRPMPRTLIDDGTLREVYHYRPSRQVRDQGDPVLLVTPLAAPAICYDLRRGCSVVEHFVTTGRPTYLVEYGAVSFRDRNLGMEHWIEEVVPAAVRAASAHAGGRPVHLVGWSLGGTFALLAAAGDPTLPIASISVVGSPFDVRQVPLVAPLRPLLNLTDGRGATTRLYQAAGGAPQPLVRWAFQLSSFQKLVTKPLALARNLDDADYLAQIEAVDRFTANMTAYPGRTFGQLYHRLLKGNALVHGTFEVGDRTLDVRDITVPVLVFGGANDSIAPIGAVRAAVPLLSGSREVRFEIVPGGHLGMLTGRKARTSTWPVLDAWIEEWTQAPDAPAAPVRPARPARKAAAKKAPAKKTAAKKAATKKTATKKTATKRTAATKAPAKKAPAKRAAATKTAVENVAPETPTIGANPERRYGSAGSRALRR
ncbi:MAG TPA: alpha/beta fold hydrolase [Nocardioides sp.]|nr:alpha/beta fold hydrolase [Nocardioides sp.]